MQSCLGNFSDSAAMVRQEIHLSSPGALRGAVRPKKSVKAAVFCKFNLSFENGIFSGSSKELDRFVYGYLKNDGIFVLRMISLHAGVIFSTDLVRSLWCSFYRIEDDHRRSHEMEQVAVIPAQAVSYHIRVQFPHDRNERSHSFRNQSTFFCGKLASVVLIYSS